MALFRFGHAQKNAFASLIALTLGQIAIGLRSLDFGLPVARNHGDCFLSIFRIACHTRLKRKELQTAQQKLSERQRRGIHVKAWGNAPGLRKSENISAESAIHRSAELDARICELPETFQHRLSPSVTFENRTAQIESRFQRLAVRGAIEFLGR
jgi:hypothetical protein